MYVMMYQLFFVVCLQGNIWISVFCHFLHTVLLPEGSGYVCNGRYTMKLVMKVQRFFLTLLTGSLLYAS
jgi:hypothetical protein